MGVAFIRNRTKQRIPKFTYTGNYSLIDEGHGNWSIKFTSSGTLTFQALGSARKGIDVFLVGGGGGGSCAQINGSNKNRHYGGGGYVTTSKDGSVKPVKGTGYSITIGSGGAGANAWDYTNASVESTGGSKTTAFGKTANGGGKSKAAVADFGGSTVYDGYNGSGGSSTYAFGESGYLDKKTYSGAKTSGDTAGGANTGTGANGNASGGSGIVVIRNHR